MAIIFEDQFQETSDTPLTSHVPSPTGTSWSQVVITGTAVVQVYGATDDIGGSAAASSNGQAVKIAPAPSQYDLDIEYKFTAVDTGTATRRLGAMAHMSDATPTNYYRTMHLPTGHASNDTELMEMTGTTKTSLATVDAGIAVNDVFVFKLRSGSQEITKNGASILTASDTSLTTPGDVGFAIGFVKTGDTGNIATTYHVDNFKVTEISTGITADLTQTQASDSSSAAAALAIAADLAGTAAGDSVSAAGILAVAASLAAPQAGDTVSSTGALSLAAALTATQASDTLTTTAQADISAALTQAQADDSLASATALLIGAALDIAQAPDGVSADAALAITANLTQTQAGDTLDASAGAPAAVIDLAQTQADDTLAADASLAIAATLDGLQADQGISAIAALDIAALFGALQADDTLTSSATVGSGAGIAADLSSTQASDSLSATIQTLARGRLTMIGAARYPGISAAARQPGITARSRQPHITGAAL